MSQANGPSENAKPKKSGKIWFVLSMGLTLAIMAWTFTLPFRSGSLSQTAAGGSASIIGARSQTGGQTAEEIRAHALEVEEEFMAQRALKLHTTAKFDPAASRIRWQERIERVRNEVKKLGHPTKGSVEWREQRELVDTLRDGPQ